MSLATRCTQCSTVFRVVPDQLRVSNGLVRCGRCDAVFDATLSLFDIERREPVVLTDLPPRSALAQAPDGSPAQPQAAADSPMARPDSGAPPPDSAPRDHPASPPVAPPYAAPSPASAAAPARANLDPAQDPLSDVVPVDWHEHLRMRQRLAQSSSYVFDSTMELPQPSVLDDPIDEGSSLLRSRSREPDGDDDDGPPTTVEDDASSDRTGGPRWRKGLGKLWRKLRHPGRSAEAGAPDHEPTLGEPTAAGDTAGPGTDFGGPSTRPNFDAIAASGDLSSPEPAMPSRPGGPALRSTPADARDSAPSMLRLDIGPGVAPGAVGAAVAQRRQPDLAAADAVPEDERFQATQPYTPAFHRPGEVPRDDLDDHGPMYGRPQHGSHGAPAPASAYPAGPGPEDEEPEDIGALLDAGPPDLNADFTGLLPLELATPPLPSDLGAFDTGDGQAAPPPAPLPPVAAPLLARPPVDLLADTTLSGLEPMPLVADGAAAGDKPSFVRAAERAAFWRRPAVRLLLGGLALLLAAGAALQAAWIWHDPLAAQWPPAKPLLQQLCEPIGCEVLPLRRIEALGVDSSGLSRIEGTSLYRLKLQLRNRAEIAVMMPALELTLTDNSGRLLSRRVLTVDEVGVTLTQLEAGQELPVQAVLAAGESAIDGYTLELFYP